MNYFDFEKALKKFPVFSLSDILTVFPKFDRRRLNEWQKKGYIVNIRRGYYCFKSHPENEEFHYYVANKIYTPSYISFESGLAYYNLIPERTFTLTSAGTRNTALFETEIGNFHYRHLKPELFFGYQLKKHNGMVFKIAEIEKAILDYFYLNKLNTPEAIIGVRFNRDLLLETINFEKLEKYQRVFGVNVLNKRIQLLKDFINA